ncbi:MAG: glutaredoxin family protein [Acidimicrobiia bacterium]
MSDFSLIFVSRSGCHLCEEAEPLVRRLAARMGAAVEVRDVEADPTLLHEYAERIPVVIGPSDQVLAEGIIDEKGLQKALEAEHARMRR